MYKIRETFEKHFNYSSLDDRQKLIVDASCWPLWESACEAILKAQDSSDKE